jgi:hypothetical protein
MEASVPIQHFLIPWHHNTFPHAEAVIQVTKEIQSMGARVTILDLTAILPSFELSISQFLLRKFDHFHYSSPRQALRSEASDLLVTVVKPRKYKNISLFLKAMLLQTHIKGTAKQLELETKWGRLGPALASELVTRIAYDEFAKVSRNRVNVFRSVRTFMLTQQLTTEVLSSLDVDSVVVFNGRLCAHAGVWEATKLAGLDVFFYEVGVNQYFFFEKFRPHNRELFQAKSKEIYRGTSEKARETVAAEFRNRRTLLSANRFLELQQPFSGTPVETNFTKRVAVIFTSSPEELIGVGDTWENSGWINQYDAICATAKRLDKLGFLVVIRIHPNIANKSWQEFNRAMKAFRGLSYSLLLPYDQVNSYELLDLASIVVVWRSTIGLEASAIGKPTYCLNPTRYDLTADVKRIYSSDDLESEEFQEYAVDSSKAMPAIFWSNTLGFGERRELSGRWLNQKDLYYRQRRYIHRINKLFFLLDNIIDIRKRPTNLFRFFRRVIGKDRTQNLIRWTYGYPRFQGSQLNYPND